MSIGLMTPVYSAGNKNQTAVKASKSSGSAAPAKDFLELLKRSSESKKPDLPKSSIETPVETPDSKDLQAEENNLPEEKDISSEAEKPPADGDNSEETAKNRQPAAETNVQAMMSAILNVPEENMTAEMQAEPVKSLPAENAGLQELQGVLDAQPEQKGDSPEQLKMQTQEPAKEAAVSQAAMKQEPEAAVRSKTFSGEAEGKTHTDETAKVQKQENPAADLSSQLKLLKSQQEEKGMRRNMGNPSGQQNKNTGTDENKQLEELKNRAEAGSQTLYGRLSEARVNGNFTVKEPAGQTGIQTPVLEQLKSGLEQGLKDDLKEFTLKLKPEGLGEIVVRLVSAGGKVGVHIGVSNPETEKLISSQMAGLKEMLQPLHAQVEEVYHNSQNGMGFTGFGQDMYKQQQQSERSGYHSGRQNFAQEDNFDAEAEKMLVESRIGRLYAYV